MLWRFKYIWICAGNRNEISAGRTTIHDDPIDGWKNGLDYLRPCLNSHKPVDIVVMMLGSNDLKATFHLTADQIASGAGDLVGVIKDFTALFWNLLSKSQRSFQGAIMR